MDRQRTELEVLRNQLKRRLRQQAEQIIADSEQRKTEMLGELEGTELYDSMQEFMNQSQEMLERNLRRMVDDFGS